jgi:prophage regulatory protein
VAAKYIRIGDLASTPAREGRIPVSAPTIWRWSKAGKFPQPVRLGPQVTAWLLQDVEAWEQSRTIGDPKTGFRGRIGAAK